MPPISVLLVDDHAAVREGYRLLLEKSGITVIGEAADGTSALKQYHLLMPDIVIIDLSLNKGMNGLECINSLVRIEPNIRIIALSMHDSQNFVSRAMRNGAKAYVLKSDPSNVLVVAIKQLYQYNKPFLSNDLAQTIASQRVSNLNDPFAILSPREHDVLLRILQHQSRQEIALELHLSAGTVSNIKARILQKLEMNNEHDLIEFSRHHNIIKQNQL